MVGPGAGIDFGPAFDATAAMGGGNAAPANGSPIDFGAALNDANNLAGGAASPGRGWHIPRPHIPSIPRPDLGRMTDALISNRAALLVRSGLRNWVDNVNPLRLREKDGYWWAGAVVGGATTVIANEFALGPVAPLIRAAVTTAISVSAPLIFKRLYSVDEQRRVIDSSTTLTADQKLEQITAAEEKYKRASVRVRNAMMGVSAGATYGGFINLAGGMTGIDQQVHDFFSKTADSSTGNAAQKIVEKAAGSGAPQLPEPVQPVLPTANPVSETITLPAGSNPTEAVTKFLVSHGVKPTPENVHEGVVKFMTQNSIKDAHFVPADVVFKVDGILPPVLPDNIAQMGAEALAKNADFQHTVTDVINSQTNNAPGSLVNEALGQMQTHAGGVPDSIFKGAEQTITDQLKQTVTQAVVDSHATTAEAAIAAGKHALETQLQDTTFHNNLITTGKSIFEEAIKHNTADFNNLLNQTTGNFTETSINAGSNVGNVLELAGHHINWMPDNAELFGAEVAINFDSLTQYWGLMDAAHYLPAGSHFPATIWELYGIIDKAKSGDSSSMEMLKLMLHHVPAGMKLRVLNAAGVNSVFGALKVLAKAA